DRTSGWLLLGLIVTREIRADRGPALPHVRGFENALHCRIEDVGIVWGNKQRRGPVKTVKKFISPVSRNIERVNRNVHELLGALVETRREALAIGKDDVGIRRIRRDVAALATTHGVPVLTADHAIVIVTLDGDCAVVLLRAVNVVRPAIVCDAVIKLRGGLV